MEALYVRDSSSLHKTDAENGVSRGSDHVALHRHALRERHFSPIITGFWIN
jgi:hypothetical protein